VANFLAEGIMLQVRLLGRFEVFVHDHLVIIPSRPTQSLLAYLLLHPNKSHRREKLAGQFWLASSEANARSNLRHELWRIRKALDPGAEVRLLSNDLGVTYCPQPGDQLDVDVFVACTENENSTEVLLQAVSAYGGDLLPGFYDEWVILEREHLQAEYERKMERLLDHLLAEGRWNETLKWGELWIASGGIPEPAYRALMLAQAGLGNMAGAITQYHRCEEALSRGLGVRPSEKTREVFRQIHEGRELTLAHSTQHVPSIPALPSTLAGLEKPVPIFVGREAELTALDRYLGKAMQGHAQVVFVSGEAGSGKSALLQEFVRRSVTAYPDLAVGWGFCNAFFGQGAPYLPFRDVLNMLTGGIEPLYVNGTISESQANRLRATFPLAIQSLVEQGPELANSFLSGSTLATRIATLPPEMQNWRQRIKEYPAQELTFTEDQEKSLLFEQYTQVLHSIANQHPLVILLDDLQWMDPGTGRLFFHLARRLQGARILIAGAYRAEEVAIGRNGERHPLEPLLNELQSTFGEIRIDLDQISETSGRDFVYAFLDTEPNHLDESFRQEFYRRTHGNPLFTIQLLRNLQERGAIITDEYGQWKTSTSLNWNSLSPEVEGVIGERFGRLDRELQELLLVASVEGEQFTVQVLEQLQGTPERIILRQLSRELGKRHHLVQELEETCVGGHRLVRFRFVHALIQQYLYRQLGVAERAALHKEIAETLEMLYKEDIAAVTVPLAQHYREAGVKQKASEYLLQAGDQARALHAHQEAIGHYQQALEYLKEIGATEQAARTLMKLYLVYHSSYDFQRAQQVLQEYKALWQQLVGRNLDRHIPHAQNPYRLSNLKLPIFDPALCNCLFDMEWINELFCGLAEWSEDRNVIPMAAKHWDVMEEGRKYVFHLRQDLFWSDGEPVTADDFEFAIKRVLDPPTHAYSANLLYDICGAKDFHQGRVANSESVGITAVDPFTLVIELEEPCSYFPYLLGDPIFFAVPKHVVEREGNAWTEPGRIVTNGAFQLDSWDRSSGNTIHFSRNPRYSGSYKGNVEHITLSAYQNELEMYHAFVAGKLDRVEFLIPQMNQDELKHYQELGQLQVSTLPFVDAVYFVTDQPPFNNPDLRRAFVLATDRKKLANEIQNQLPATGGYLPPDLPGHSPDIGLPYDPHEAQRLLDVAGYPQGRGFPPVSLLLGLVGLKKGDDLVFASLHEMWKENLGITIQNCWNDSAKMQFETSQDFHFFFVGWLADYPDPASFLQTNYLIEQCHWQSPKYEALVEAGRRTLDHGQRMNLYRQADRILIEEAVILPLFYGHIYELRQPWVQRPTGSSIYSPKWEDVTLLPH